MVGRLRVDCSGVLTGFLSLTPDLSDGGAIAVLVAPVPAIVANELGPESGFQRTDDPVAVCIRNRSPDTNRVAVKQRLRARRLEITERCLEIIRPACWASMFVYGKLAGNAIGSKHRLERVSDCRARSIVFDSAGVNDETILIAKRQTRWD
jgi:hypothetical protein